MTLRGKILGAVTLLAGQGALAQDAPPAVELPPPPAAQSAEPLALDMVLRAVDASFPLLEAARQERDSAEGSLRAAEGAFDPSLQLRGTAIVGGYYEYVRGDLTLRQPTQLWGATLFAGYRIGRGISSGGIPDYYGNYETNEAGEVRAGVQVPLLRNGPIDSRRAGIRRAELGRPIASLNVESASLLYRRGAAEKYWDWVAAGRRLAIARSLLTLATERNQAIAARVERGDLPAIERNDNLRVVAQRRGRVVSAERGLQRAAIELSLYFRDAEGRTIMPTEAQLPADLPEPTPLSPASVADDREAALARRPEVRRLTAQRAQVEVDRELASNQMMPAIDVSLAASQDLGEGAYQRARPDVEASLMLDIPILNRVARGRLEVARAGLARLDEQLRYARDRVLADVRDALSAVETALERAELATQERDIARTVAASERTNFELGNSTILSVNLREQAAAEAALRVVDARADYHKAVAAYRAATARP